MPRTSRWAWPAALGLAALSFVMALLVGRAFFENLSVNNDEAVYVLEAQAFANGQLTLSDSAHGDAFRPWMSGRVEGDRLVLVEQPLLPALMAATDLAFGSMRVAVGLVAAGAVLAIFALTRELLGDDRTAVVAAGCFTLSPLVIIQSAMYVSYVLAVALAATALTLIARGLARRAAGASGLWWLVGGGAVHGVLLATRPLEGITLGAVELAWLAVRRVGWPTGARTVGLLAAGAAPVMVLALLYNELTTGNPFVFALWTIGGDDSFGFGPRAIAEHAAYVDVGPAEAWLALRMNLRAFPHWILGGLVAVPVGAWGAWRLWHRDRTVFGLLVTMLVAYPFAYFFYYGNYLIIGGRMMYGPHYYLALLIPSMILLAVGLVDVASRRWPWIAGVCAALVVATVVEIPDKVRRNLRIRDDIAAEADAVDAAVEGPAVVIIPAGVDGPYVLHPRGALGNPPDLDAEVLFAADLGGRNLDLVDRFPDRRVFRLQRVTTHDGFRPDVIELDALVSRSVELEVTTRPAPDEPDVITSVLIGSRSVPCPVVRGNRYEPVTVTFGPDEATIDGCGPIEEVAVPDGPTTVTFALTDPDAPAGVDAGSVEVRYWARIGDEAVAALVPGELWLRHPGRTDLEVIDPSLAPWVSQDSSSEP